MKAINKVKGFVKKHKEEIMAIGAFAVFGGCCYYLGRTFTLLKLADEMRVKYPEIPGAIALHDVASIGGNGYAYINSQPTISSLEQLGDLGKEALEFNNDLVDHEVVGALIYTKKK